MIGLKKISALPPVAVPIAMNALFKALLSRWDPEDRAQLNQIVLDYFGSRILFWVSSGRAALFILISSLMEHSEKREVILPAYTCPTVYFAIRKAGLEPRFCDIDEANLGLKERNLTELLNKRTLTIVAHHLFGIPCDIDNIILAGKEFNITTIEDIAQSLGAKIGGKTVGSFGDFTFFSLGKGKVITTDNGGAILINNEHYLNSLDKIIHRISSQTPFEQFRAMVTMVAYPLILKSFFWWLIEKTSLNPEYRHTPEDFEVRSLSKFQSVYTSLIFREVDRFNEVRIKNGNYLLKELSHINSILLPQIPEDHEPIFLRFPVLFKDTDSCGRVYNQLNRLGLGVSRMNPYNETVKIAQSYGDFPNAQFVSQRILTLPTHYRLNQGHLDTICSVIDDNV